MTGRDLLTGLGYIGTDLYAEADTHGIAENTNRRLLSSPLVIAALIALMALLMGCAWFAMNLEELRLGEHSYTQPRYIDEDGNRIEQTEKQMEVLSLQGIAGTPEFLAAQEWLLFTESYDPDGLLLDEADSNPIDVSREYDAYFVYTQEMVNKVDEIAEKYNLNLAGSIAMTNKWDGDLFKRALGLNNLYREGYPISVEYASGYFYACGNYKADFYITLPEESQWDHPILASMRYCRKGYLDTVFSYIRNEEPCSQRHFRQNDGQELLIVTTDDYALLLCDSENGFITVSFSTICQNEDDSISRMTDQNLELIAQALNFSAAPKEPDMEAVQKQLDASFAQWEAEHTAIMETYKDPFAPQNSYAAKIQKIMDNGIDPDNYYYELYDINGDGSDELLLSCDTESFGPIYTMYNGETYTLLAFGIDQYSFLCENGIVLYNDPVLNPNVYTFYKVGEPKGEGRDYAIIDEVFYSVWDNAWVRRTYGSTTEETFIAEEEAIKIIESYGRIELEMKPISTFSPEE